MTTPSHCPNEPGSLFVYAAKFVCGVMPELPQPTEEGPVEPGSYATAINIHNPHAKPVVFLKKAVLLFDLDSKEVERLFEPPKPPSALHRAELLPDWGMEVDCRDIRQELLSGQASPAPVFIKGWVIIESPDPLDVVAVYTVRGAGDVSIATDRVIPTRR
jgi:hypothetical protein